MNNNEQAILLILIFLFPILGLLCDSMRIKIFPNIIKRRTWFLTLTCASAFFLVLNFIFSGNDVGANFTFKNIFFGLESETGFKITPFAATCVFAFSLANLFFHLITSNFRNNLPNSLVLASDVLCCNENYPFKLKRLKNKKDACIPKNQQGQYHSEHQNHPEPRVSRLGWGMLIVFSLSMFAEGKIIFALALIAWSAMHLFFSNIQSGKRFEVFVFNVISDFVLFFVLFIFLSNFSKCSELTKVFLGLGTITAIFYKCSLPPFTWHKNYQQTDEKSLFLTLIRFSLIFILFQRFNPVLLESNITLIILILVLTAMILEGLIRLLLSKNLYFFLENSSFYASVIFIFLNTSNQQETLFLAFISVLFSVLLLFLSVLLLANNNANILKTSNENEIFSFSHLGGLSKIVSITFAFFILAGFSISFIAPLTSGWAMFSFVYDSETWGSGLSNLLHNLISFVIAISGLFLMLIFAGFAKLIFLGEFRCKGYKLVDITPPGRKFILPGIFISIILILSGFLLLPAKSESSQLLSVFFGNLKRTGLNLEIESFLGLSRFVIVAVHFALLIICWFVGIFFIKNLSTNELLTIKKKIKVFSTFETKIVSKGHKIKGFYQRLSVIYYILFERILFDFLFWHIASFIKQVSLKLRAKLKNSRQENDLILILLGVLTFFVLTILLILF